MTGKKDLSTRLWAVLEHFGVEDAHSAEELARFRAIPVSAVLKRPNVGLTTLAELRGLLTKHGVTLGETAPPPEPSPFSTKEHRSAVAKEAARARKERLS